ncbi:MULTISPECIES: HAD family hydrolase [unclassified Halomonas]|uniref:HAD family hydrolase n=1 Tax=unclassified Halomonas TaxID=2609666 RepID=UPI002076A7D6|nr:MULTISPECIES: HAD family hydrolase [unclassified Halomonas]
MKLTFNAYETLVFDCDGVVLNSNQVKSQAFYQAALPYGNAAAQALVDYHIQNGGISRYKKFAYFLENLVPGQKGPALDELLDRYAAEVYEGLMGCDIAERLQTLRAITANARWLIVSGGDQAELRKVFAARGLAELFDGGIFGSPDTKDEILTRELKKGNIQQPALFLGDSKYDWQAASAAKLDFVFLYNWSEVTDWENWTKQNKIKYALSLAHIN